MSSLGDVASALAPAAQGLTQGRLAGAQEQIQHQQYQNSLDLQKQEAQLKAKGLDLQQRQFEHQKTTDAINAGLSMLKDIDARLDNPSNWQTPDSQIEKVHLQQLRSNIAGATANAGKSGDASGIFSVLGDAENHVQTNGTIAGLPPHPAAAPIPDQGAPGGGGTAPTATAPAAIPQPAIPPEVAQMLSGLSPALGAMFQASAQGAQAQPAAQPAQSTIPPQVLQLLQNLTSPSNPAAGQTPPIAGLPADPQMAQMQAGLLGVGAPPGPSTAAGPPTPSGAAPQVTSETPRQDIINNPAAMTPTPAPGPITSSGYQNLPPGLESAIVNSRAKSQAIQDRLNPDSFTQAGNETATQFEARKSAALDRIEKTQTQQATYEKNILDPYFKQVEERDRKIDAANALASKERLAKEGFETQIKVAQIAAGGHLRELAMQGKRLTETEQKDYLVGVKNSLMVENRQDLAHLADLKAPLPSLFRAALSEQDVNTRGAYQSGTGGLNIGIPDMGLGFRANGTIGSNQSTKAGVVWKADAAHPNTLAYLQQVGQINEANRTTNSWAPPTYQAARDANEPRPNEVTDLQKLVGSNGDMSNLVKAFHATVVTRPGLAYRMLQAFPVAFPGQSFPAGMDYAALRGIKPVSQPAAQSTPAPPALAPGVQPSLATAKLPGPLIPTPKTGAQAVPLDFGGRR